MNFPANFECCHQCVPPKRQPGCHGSCEEYCAIKAERDQKIHEYRVQNAAAGYTYHAVIANKNRAAIHRKSMAGIHPHTGNT